MSRFRGLVILLTFALVILLVGGGLLYLKTRMAAEQLRHVAERTLAHQLNLPVQIGSVSLSLLRTSVDLRQITVGDRSTAIPVQAGQRVDLPLLTVDRATVTFRPSALLRGALQIRALIIQSPRLAITDSPASSSSLAQLISGLSEISDDRKTEGFPILLEQGAIAYRTTAPLRHLQVDGLRGRLDWPSPDQAVIAVVTDDMTVQLGTYNLHKIRLDARARLTRDDLQVEQLNLAKNSSSFTLTRIVRTDARRPQVELNVAGRLDPAALALRLGGTAPWSRYLTVKGTIVTETTPPTFKTSLLLEDDSGRLVGQTDMMVQNGLLTVKGLALHQSASRLTADGTVELRTMTADLNVGLEGRLEDAVRWFRTDTPVAGPITATLRFTGLASNLNGVGDIEMRQMRIGTEQIDALEAQLALQGTGLTIASLAGRYHGIPFKASGAIESGGQYQFSVVPTKVDVASIRTLAEQGGSGGLIVSLSGAGQWPERRVNGELAVKNLAFHDVEVGSGRVRFAIEQNRWRWELVGGRTLHATGIAPLLLNGPLEAEVSAIDLNIEPLLQALRSRLRFPLTAHADGRARLVGTLPNLRDITGWIDVTHVRGMAGLTPIGLRQPTRVVLQSDTLRVDSLELTGPSLSVRLTGSLGPDGQLELSVSGHAPFDIVGPWVPALRDLQGAPRIRFSLVGNPGTLRITGRAELAHLQIKPKIIPIWVSVDSGEVVFDNDRVHYIVAEGTTAKGRLKGEGSAQRYDGSWHHRLQFDLDPASIDVINDQLLPERRWVSGTLATRASLAFDITPERPTMPTLQGQLSMRLKGGSLSHYPALVRLIGLLGAPAQPYRLPDLTRERMPYRRLSADIEIKDGVMHTTNLLLDSEVMRLTAAGQMKLADQHVDLVLAVRPLQVLEQGIRRIPLLGRVLPKTQSLAITYFDMKGPWDNPTISIAPVKSLSQTVRDLLQFLLLAPWRAISPDR